MWGLLLVWLALLALPGSAAAAFHEVDGPDSSGQNGGHPVIADVGGVPHAAWLRLSAAGYELHAASLGAAGWTPLGGAIASWKRAGPTISLANVGGGPVLAWAGDNANPATLEDVHVARWTGTAWSPVAGSPAVTPGEPTYGPSLVGLNALLCLTPPCSYPEVAFGEEAGGGSAFDVRVAFLSNGAWSPVGGVVNTDTNALIDQIHLVQVGLLGPTAVAWLDHTDHLVHVAYYDVTKTPPAWTPAGVPLQAVANGNDDSPVLADIGGSGGTTHRLYAAWSENDGAAGMAIRVARFDYDPSTDTGVWSLVGGPVSIDSYITEQPSLADVGGVPYLAWTEQPPGPGTSTQVHVARFDGNRWTPIGGALNHDPSAAAGDEQLASIGGLPYVVWAESSGGGASRVRAARYIPPTCPGQSISVPHATPVTASLVCSDGAGDVIRVLSQPAHGTLSAPDAGGHVVYTPAAGYAGQDSFTFTGNDGAMDAPAATATLNVAAAGGGGPVRVTALRIAPAVFRAASRGGSVAAVPGRPPVGAAVSFTLSRAATVVFTVAAGRPGIRRGRSCVAPPARLRPGSHPRHCRRFVRLPGSFGVAGAAGVSRFRFSGRLRRRALAPGRYHLIAAAGRQVAFRIVR